MDGGLSRAARPVDFVGRPKPSQLKAGPAAGCQLDGPTKTGPTVTVGPASFKHWTAMAYRGVQ